MKNKSYRLEPKFSNSSRKCVKNPSVPFLKLFQYASNIDKFLLFLGVIFTAGSAACRPLNMLVFGSLTGSIIQYASDMIYAEELTENEKDEILSSFMTAVTNFAIFNSIIGMAMLLFTHLSVLIFNYTALKQIFKIRTLYFNSVLNQDIEWHDVNQTGDFASRMSEDLNKLEDGIGEKLPLFLHSMFTSVFCITLALLRGWELALVCLSSLPLTLMSLTVVSKITSKVAKEELDAYGTAGSIAEEVLTNIRTVVAFGGEEKELTRYENELIFARNNNIKRSLLSAIGFGLLWFFNYAIYSLAFWYGINLILKEISYPETERIYTPGNMVTVFFSVMEGSTNFGMVAPYIETFAIAKAAATEVFSVINKKPFINLSKTEGKKMLKMKGKLVFKNVHFNYPTRPEVSILRGINLEIEAGQTVALVGSSGCGKSTCIQLIQRFYDPRKGTITLDGIDLKEYNLSWLRSNFGVVGQEPVLFATTVAENIKMGNLSASKEQIVNAAIRANAHDFIQGLPQGYDTPVTGAHLSGGQKQRIAIARALVREPVILLLDEATSALDTHSEAMVQKAIDAASKSCTTIIVAHRLSTIRNANKIIVFANGQIVEEGTYKELFDRKGHFYELVLNQGGSSDHENDDTNDKDFQEDDEDDIASSRSSEETVNDYDYTDQDVKHKKKPKVNPSSLWSILRMNKPEWWQLFLGCLTSIITGCALPIFAVLFGDILGILSNSNTDYIRSQTNLYCIYFIIMAVITGPATFMQIHMFGIAGEKLVMRIRKQMFGAMLKQEIGWYDAKDNSVGNLCTKLSLEASSVQGATGQRIGTTLQSMATLLLGVSLSMYFEWRLGLVTLAFAPFVLIATFFQKRIQASRDQPNGSPIEKSTKIAVEAVSNIRTVVSLGNENLFFSLYTTELMCYYKVTRRSIHIRALVLALARSLLDFAFSTCIYYGGILIRDENLNYSNVFKVAQSLIFGTVSIANTLAFTPNFQKGLMSASKIFCLIHREPKIKDNSEALLDSWQTGNINFSNIHFRYPTRPLVKILNGLDLSVFNGKTVALVGSSGCGKSTIIQLLERFYDSEKGNITIGEQEIKNFKLKSLRSNLGIVSQEPNLFDRTIAENIAYGDNDRVTDINEIVEAAKKANIHHFVTSLPMGYDTRLGEKGAQLSGGQKQRIAIARALIRNPKVLLLDEATSALDNESEKIVQLALEEARQGRTCITIAHRLTTIKDADLICVLNSGKITESGTHPELMKRKGLYEKLYTLQMSPNR